MGRGMISAVVRRSIVCRTIALGSAGVALAAAAPASATIVFMDFAGTVTSGNDSGGLFGAAGADLSGQSFVVHYVFDTTLGHRTGPSPDQLVGGAAFNDASPSIGATVTVNGSSYTIVGDQFAEDNAAWYEDYATAQSSSNETLINYVFDYNNPLGTAIDRPFSLTVASNAATNYGALQTSSGTSLVFHNTTISGGVVPTVAAVPEPRTWAMMVIGFGATGSSLRRRRMAVSHAR